MLTLTRNKDKRFGTPYSQTTTSSAKQTEYTVGDLMWVTPMTRTQKIYRVKASPSKVKKGSTFPRAKPTALIHAAG